MRSGNSSKRVIKTGDSFTLFGKAIDDDGYHWTIAFHIRFGITHNFVGVTMRNTTSNRVYRAPKDADKILAIWPIELWPEYARHLAVNKSVNSPENTHQERLF